MDKENPDDDERRQRMIVRKALKMGLISIPLIMYVSWAYKKFVPCPRVRHKPSITKRLFARDKKMNRVTHKDTQSTEEDCQDVQWPVLSQEKQEPSKDEYMDYLKRSARDCCEAVSKHKKGHGYSNAECYREHSTASNQQMSTDFCGQQVNEAESERDQSKTQSQAITPEAFDKLFQQHFENCVEDFKNHKKKFEKELERMEHCCEHRQKINKSDHGGKKANYLECLADLNMDKDFECDPNFHSKNSDAPYVVKNYKCKKTSPSNNEKGANKNQSKGASYLQCLTDLNIDKNFEDKDTKGYSINETVNECCPKTKGSDSNIQTKMKPEDNECDTNFSTSSNNTDTYGAEKGDPCEGGKEEEESNDKENALKDFWHACSPPKGIKQGCQAEECKNPCEKYKR